MRLPLVTRRVHKWLSLFVGIQALLWSLTGLYMVAVSIDVIHGDQLVRPPGHAPFEVAAFVDPSAVVAQAPAARTLRLVRRLDRPLWVVETDGGLRTFDARSGEPLPPPSEALIRAIARQRFAGSAPIVEARRLGTVPAEVRGRPAPIWRVVFAGWNEPTLYLSAATGELLTRRHNLWRIYDFAWMLHIMDYDERENVNNPLLRALSWAAVLAAASGAWLLVYSFSRRRLTRASR